MKQIGFPFFVVLVLCHFMRMAFALPENDPNLAMNSLADGMVAQIPKDSRNDRIALIPLSAAAQKLNAIGQVLTSMLASQLTIRAGDNFIGLDRPDWDRFPTDGGLLSTKRVKQYGKFLRCRWLITGQVSDFVRVMNVNLFLWDAHTGYLRHWEDCQLSHSAALTSLYSTMPPVKLEPYYRKWNGLPDADYFALAIEVADVDGDGFNELIVADQKRVKALRWEGFNYRKQPHLPEIQYREDETPIRGRDRRTMLGANRDGSDRDEIYIGSPPNQTWRVEWKENLQAEITNTDDLGAPGMFLAQGENRLIVGRTAADGLTYQGRSTVCLEWQGDRIRLKHPCPLDVDSVVHNFKKFSS